MEDIKTLRETPVEQLKLMIENCFKELFVLKTDVKSGEQMTKSHEMRNWKKQIARIKTILRQKKEANN
jgi:ribosomal protein L29